MSLVACGINHKTASLTIREKLATHVVSPEIRLKTLLKRPSMHAAMLLSTCNRTELYAQVDDATDVLDWFAMTHQVNPVEIASSFYCYENDEAVRHMLRVAVGIDSMMLGEPQILGQMKQAFQQAAASGTLNHELRRVCSFVFGASKRIRHRSGISNNPISVASAAVRILGETRPDYHALHAFIIGSGETAKLVAKYLKQHGVSQFTVVSRTEANARRLAEQLNGAAFLTINDIPSHLPHADVIVSATACPLPFITPSMVQAALLLRQQKPMFFIDLAVPRDIEAEVGELDNVHLVNIDDLHQCIQQGLRERQLAANLAEDLIADELLAYNRWNLSLRATPIICDYRHHMQALAQQELQRASKKLSNGQCKYAVLDEFCERLVKKLTHIPTVNLRQAATNNHDELLDLAQSYVNSSLDTVTHEDFT